MPDDVAAHDQRTSIHLLCHYPEHSPRQGDEHYAIFEASVKRMKASGLWKCAISGCKYPGPLEVHHHAIEYALQGGVDLAKFNELYGLHLDDEGFKEYIESPGALEVLCPVHHRTHLGIHEIPGPLWDAMRVWRDDLAPPAEVVTVAAPAGSTVTVQTPDSAA